jgi:hypothetical protein
MKLTVDRNDLTKLRTELKKIDPALLRALGKELKSELQPFANSVQGRMPSASPLSNLASGQKPYVAPKVKVAARPGAGWGKPIVLFTVDGVGNKIAEFAGKGKKSYIGEGGDGRWRKGYTQGRAFIRNLDAVQSSPAKEGRFFFQAYKSSRRSSQQAVGRVLDRFIEKGMGNV